MLLKGIKVFIFILGLIALVGLSVCGVILGKQEFSSSRNYKDAYLDLHQKVNQNKASVYEKWLYALALTHNDTKHYFDTVVDAKQATILAGQYKQEAINAKLPEALLQNSLQLLSTFKTDEPLPPNFALSDQKTNSLNGLIALQATYKQSCATSYKHDFYPNIYSRPQNRPEYLIEINTKYLDKVLLTQPMPTDIKRHFTLVKMVQLLKCMPKRYAKQSIYLLISEDDVPIELLAGLYVVAEKMQDKAMQKVLQAFIEESQNAQFLAETNWFTQQFDERFGDVKIQVKEKKPHGKMIIFPSLPYQPI